MAGEWKNRIGNIVATPVRAVVGAPAHAAVDFGKTLIAVGKDFKDIQMQTANEIQETISEAGKKGKWYHKVFNIPAASVGSVAKAVTGSVGATINAITNGVVNAAYNVRDFVSNEARVFGSTFSSKPVSDFSFKKHDLRKIWNSLWHPKNRLIGGAAAATAVTATAASKSTPAPQAVVAQAPVEDSETKKIITDLTARLEKQEKTNQELQNTLLVTQSDVDAVKKENRGLKTLLKQYSNDKSSDTKKELEKEKIDEKIDSDNESPKKNPGKSSQ